MAKPRISYRPLKQYKYQLMNDYSIQLDLKLKKNIKTKFIELSSKGRLKIKDRYSWDGPSGPTIDTKTFMRGSLVHDALYQLMREKKLDYKKHRELADVLLKEICLEDGMWSFRAWYVHRSLQAFGEKNAKPPKTPKEMIMRAP